ncbi:hypothetical protein BMF94_3905 [Rhodotorula taiwanensis]|uniref:GDP/GTP exchange factor Sec2 N-terminal domain-containing protein n=1 Tax=Rhodotorula taiwanensis TaxID=741276 RepID=A0A2S5B8H8_9BASI|nr:hypothetical protein BMF94_3905 [Rhodotorula taiwanensis]
MTAEGMGMAEPAEAATPVASSSSTLRTSPAKYGSLANSTGPSLPTTVAEREKRHSRRPSRAERYESVIATARETLRRATGGYDDADLQVGPASDPLLAERRRRSKRLSSASFEPLPERDWRETVRSLLSVVDGMSQQLASHDELATELKIAQSNLSLASAHSEFLEETLRRRESRNSASHLMARQHSTGESLPSLNSQSRRGSTDVASPESGGAGGLFGLGLSTEADAGGAKSFFRLPSKRKSPNPAAPAPSAQQSMESGGMQFARRLRSVGSSPALNKGFFSSEPAPPLPLPPRESTSTVSSTDFPSSPVPADEVGITTPLAAEVFALRAQVSSLETECTALRSTNASLKRNSETLVAKCAELEKTKDDLLSELENLSVELFSEANALVAEERRARAKAEEEVERLNARIASITGDIDSIRINGSEGPPAPSKREAEVGPTPITPLQPIVNANQPFSSSPITAQTTTTEAPGDRPQSVASIASSAARSWFSFGRSSSQVTGADGPPPLPTTSPVATTSTFAEASTSTLASRQTPWARSPVADAFALNNVSPGLSGSRSPPDDHAQFTAETSRPPPSPKGKEKARTLDLGIEIPTHDSVGHLQSAFSATPGSGGTVGRHSLRSDVDHSRAGTARSPITLHSARFPLLSPDSTSSSESTSSHGHGSTRAEPSAPPQESVEGLAVPARRPRRPESQAAPRPYAVLLERTPPGLNSGFNPSDLLVGGPSASEMTAGAKSPRSPNDLRWAKISGSLQPGLNGLPTPASSAASIPARVEEGVRRKASEGPPRNPAMAGHARSEAPALGGETSRLSQQPSIPEKRLERSNAVFLGQRPDLRPVDTTASTLAPPSEEARRRRPHSAGTGASRPGFPPSANGFAAYSTAQAALASGPASANPAGPSRSSRSPIVSNGGSFGSLDQRTRGMTPSTSLSSLASNSSLSSTGGPTSSSGHSTVSGGGGRHGLGSPDDTKAAQDLENLMQNILEMSEGMFGHGGLEDSGGATQALPVATVAGTTSEERRRESS